MSDNSNNGHRFADRVAIVTGASSVLGGASARALAREGAKVALSYRSGAELANQTVQDIEAAGGIACAGHLDVTDPGSVQTFVDETVARYGAVDLLINAAGRIDAADAVRFRDIDLAAWDALFEVDVKGTFLMCRAVVPHMDAQGGGAIVNFASTFGNGMTQENMVNSCAVQYCAAKSAVNGFTASLAPDLAPRIRVNAVAPGAIEANWDVDWGIPAEHLEEAVAMTPLKRMGWPDEIAETVLFLASDGAGYITGQTLFADGGCTLAG